MENIEKNKYWIWFSLIEGIDNIKKKKLLDEFKSPEEIYINNKKKLMKVKWINEKIVENIIKSKNERIIEKHQNYMKNKKIEIINIIDKEYPDKLKQIYDPPISLYVKGNKSILNENKTIAVIGCRDYSEYGRKAAIYFSYNLSKKGIGIISGLAKGIDSFAHLGNLMALQKENKERSFGKTIAVLGTGLDRIYPKENIELAKKIIDNDGVIITEYPCGTKIKKTNFPQRNRIVSGISDGVLVIEAKEKSGTLITVDFALEQNKEVFVVPGNINSMNSIGTNNLIKEGAKCVTNYSEIMESI